MGCACYSPGHPSDTWTQQPYLLQDVIKDSSHIPDVAPHTEGQPIDSVGEGHHGTDPAWAHVRSEQVRGPATSLQTATISQMGQGKPMNLQHCLTCRQEGYGLYKSKQEESHNSVETLSTGP
jgi:hypothetical protein